jgi:hypothetical protein
VTQSIEKSLFTPATPHISPPPLRTGQETFRQVATAAQAARITLQTAEGDIVTFSGLFENHQAMEARRVSSPLASREQLSSLQVERGSLAVSVQGDLNEEELADIVRLVNDLTAIAASFFAGEHEAAMAAALQLGEMGSVSRLSATFSQQVSLHSRLISSHPMPASLEKFSEELRRQIPLAEENSPQPRPDQGALRKARWQQILEAIDRRAEETAATASARPSREKTALRMMRRLEETLRQHPIFSPFSTSLAAKALSRAAAQQPVEAYPATTAAFAPLQEEFARQFQQWLHGTSRPAES